MLSGEEAMTTCSPGPQYRLRRIDAPKFHRDPEVGLLEPEVTTFQQRVASYSCASLEGSPLPHRCYSF